MPPQRIDLNNPLSWQIWQLMEVTNWQHLPYPGGLLDQPEWLWDDLLTLNSRANQVRRMLKPEKS